MKRKHEELMQEKAGLAGEMRQLNEQNKRLKKELDVEYKDVDVLYRRQYLRLRTQEIEVTVAVAVRRLPGEKRQRDKIYIKLI